MRRNRLILYALWILSLVGISYFGGPVSYGFFIMLTLVPVVSALYALYVFLQFKIYQRLGVSSVVAGQNTDFYFTLQNEDRFSFSGISVYFFSGFSTISGLETGIEYELLPKTGVQKQTGIVCKYRGEYEIGVKQVVVQDYFRLFRFVFKNRETLRAEVKPRLVFLEDIHHADMLLVSARDSYTNRSELDVLVREYVPGDDIRYINWKSTARRQKLTVRNRIGEDRAGISIIMDSMRYSSRQEDFLPVENKLLESALALSWYYLDNGIRAQVYTLQNNSLREHVMANMSLFEDFYAFMSGFVFSSEQGSDLMATELERANLLFESRFVIYVVHQWDEIYAKHAKMLADYGIPAMAYVITDEEAQVRYDLGFGDMELVQVPVEAELTEVL